MNKINNLFIKTANTLFFMILNLSFLFNVATIVTYKIKALRSYKYICAYELCAKAAQTDRPNWLKCFEETHGYPGGNTREGTPGRHEPLLCRHRDSQIR